MCANRVNFEPLPIQSLFGKYQFYITLYDLLNVASFRDIAKEWKVIASLLPLFSFHENSDMRVQAMRAVGNLCIDHGERLVILYFYYYPMRACAARGY